MKEGQRHLSTTGSKYGVLRRDEQCSLL